MPLYWLKPLGVTEPLDLVPDDWLQGADPAEPHEFDTGPAKRSLIPQIGPNSLVLLHAVGHSRIFAQVRIISGPDWPPKPKHHPRWPWTYRSCIELFVPLVGDGPRTADAGISGRAMGAIKAGREYAKLTPSEYEAALSRLAERPTARRPS